MRYALNPLIIAIISELKDATPSLSFNGNAIDVFTSVSVENLLNDGVPVVVIRPANTIEIDVNKDDLSHEYVIEIEVYSKFAVGLGGWGNNNDIVDQVLAKFRPNVNVALDLSADNFKIIAQEMDNISSFIESFSDSVLYSNTISITFNITDLTT